MIVYYPKNNLEEFRNKVILVDTESESYTVDYNFYYHLDKISKILKRPYDIYGLDNTKIHPKLFKYGIFFRGEIFVIAKSREEAAIGINNIYNAENELGYWPRYKGKHVLSFRYYLMSTEYGLNNGLLRLEEQAYTFTHSIPEFK
jgi:hypothetical protein